ncbi:HEXXH motif domain-containing protein [Kineosporia mesophila]|uniref:HEXXH motif domain-containing protein n=1 Tax=Kineosporia mesophila TaxID=566012 RepID=A0ABP6Z3K7_9ACTN|nr:HEXXH motif-containing putative peptide modification protein [Kineosporia mesophila]MCD5352603.1 HEXXH motif-containing putative peptide modification protein [Kineosporia mesophila]
MSHPTHSLPAGMLDELAAGRSDPAAIQVLTLARRSKVLLALRFLMERSAGLDAGTARRTAAAYALLAQVQSRNRSIVDELLAYPAVSAWVLRTAVAMATGPARPDALALVAAAAAHRSGQPYEIEVPLRPALVLPGIGRFTSADAAGLGVIRRSSAGGDSRLRGPSGRESGLTTSPGWVPLERISCSAGGIDLRLLVDGDDLGSPDGSPLTLAHPGPSTVRTWAAALARAWETLVDRHREVAQEVAAMFVVLTPVEAGTGGHSSATAVDAHGGLLMSSPGTALTVAEIFAHEVQHAKLALIVDVHPLLRRPAPGEDGPRFYVPWRLDPRPPMGMLHGAYAHLGVAEFWRRRQALGSQRERQRAQVNFARWRSAVAEVVARLRDHSELTPVGRRFVEGMSRTVNEMLMESVPATAQKQARALAQAHRRAAKARPEA